MYHERLRGYRKLGYIVDGDELSFERKVYSTFDYRNKLLSDIKESMNAVVLVINDYEDEALNELLELNNNVYLYSNLLINFEHKNISGLYKSSLDINVVIIDSKIVWYGGINPFKNNKFDDSIMRINDKSIADNLIKEIKSSI